MWGNLEVIGAEQVDGTNYVAWELEGYDGGQTNYELWQMSSDWSEVSDSRWLEGGSNELYSMEVTSNIDIDGDGEIGKSLTLTSVETVGAVSLFADNSGYLYASIPGSDETTGIYAWGMQLEQSMWGNLEVIGAEQVDGTNYVAWELESHDGGQTNYELWEMSSDWSEVSDSRWLEGGSNELYSMEVTSNIDIDGDGEIGAGETNQNNSAPIQIGPGHYFNAQSGSILSIYDSDLLKGFIDPDGDNMYIDQLWTEYGQLNLDSAGNAWLPINDGQIINIIYDPFEQVNHLFVPDDIDPGYFPFYYTISDSYGNTTVVSQSLNISQSRKPQDSYNNLKEIDNITGSLRSNNENNSDLDQDNLASTFVDNITNFNESNPREIDLALLDPFVTNFNYQQLENSLDNTIYNHLGEIVQDNLIANSNVNNEVFGEENQFNKDSLFNQENKILF